MAASQPVQKLPQVRTAQLFRRTNQKEPFYSSRFLSKQEKMFSSSYLAKLRHEPGGAAAQARHPK